MRRGERGGDVGVAEWDHRGGVRAVGVRVVDDGEEVDEDAREEVVRRRDELG